VVVVALLALAVLLFVPFVPKRTTGAAFASGYTLATDGPETARQVDTLATDAGTSHDVLTISWSTNNSASVWVNATDSLGDRLSSGQGPSGRADWPLVSGSYTFTIASNLPTMVTFDGTISVTTLTPVL
jgi:hypothetical protein